VKIIDCDQRSPEWYAARAGIPTASEFKTVLRERGRTKGSESAERRSYILKLAGERITGDPATSYENAAMVRGREMEPQAREDYAFIHDVEPQLIGFVTLDDGTAGASPDSLIGADGMLEIKTAEPHILLGHMRSGEFPAEHKAQCQGGLWICEREWIDLCIYWPKMKPLVIRAYRDEAFIAELAKAVEAFNAEVAEAVEWYRRYGAAA
jgi:hypothetical protein